MAKFYLRSGGATVQPVYWSQRLHKWTANAANVSYQTSESEAGKRAAFLSDLHKIEVEVCKLRKG